MVSSSYSNLFQLASGEYPFGQVSRRIPSVMSISDTMTNLDIDLPESVCSDHSSPSSDQQRLIIVCNQLPIRAERKPEGDGWIFGWDDNSILLHLKDNNDREVFYVGCLKYDIHPSEEDEVSQILLERFNCVPAFLSSDLYSRYYLKFCKEYLWPLFHYMLPFSPELGGQFNRFHWQAYVSVNKIFADRIMEIINPDDDFVWIHDYHLMVLPTFLRKRFNRIKLGFFLHSPFPSSEIYKTLPIREEILRGLLNTDLIGFHTFDYARHFLSCCSRLLGISNESKRGYIGIDYYGRTVSVKILPVGIHMAHLQSVLNRSETESKVAQLVKEYKDKGRTMIIGVDDMDIFKGVSLKLLAMEQLLIHHSEWHGKLVLVQIVNPAWGQGKDVLAVQNETNIIVERINKKFGQSGYTTVVLIAEPLKFYEKIAYYVVAECCLVTAIRDGMNLTAYQYIISRQSNEELDRILGLEINTQRKSMLVVSEFIGCSPIFEWGDPGQPMEYKCCGD